MKNFAIIVVMVLFVSFSTGKADAQFFELTNFSLAGINVDQQKGMRLDVLKSFVLTKPFLGFARFGAGLGFLSFYFDSRIPELEYDDPVSTYKPGSIKHGHPIGAFPVSVYFCPIAWGLNERVPKSVYFYWEYWFVTGGTAGKRSADPQPSSFSEYGMCFSPFGALLSLNIFYRNMTIPEGYVYRNETDYTQTTFVTYVGGTRSARYHFPGYKENFFGVSANFYLGAMSAY